MKPAVRSALVLALMLPLSIAAQESAKELKEFTRTLRAAEGLQISLVHLNAKTLPIIFQPPTLYAMRARAYQGTVLYVQGTTQRDDVDLDPTLFTLEQDGQSTPGRIMNIKNFQKGSVAAKGTQIDGLVEFSTRVDLAKAFKVSHGAYSVEFKFNERQIKDAMPPAVAQN